MKETKDIKKSAKTFFKRNRYIFCPAFPEEKIIFNSKGLSHLFYKGANKKFANIGLLRQWWTSEELK